MLENWIEKLKKNRASGSMMMKANPKLMEAYQAFNTSSAGNNSLQPKFKELICLAVAVTTRCDGCIAAHASAARKAGATEAEVADALGVAMAMNTGAAYVYSIRAMEAFNQFCSEGA